jgi:hypothetical protein
VAMEDSVTLGVMWNGWCTCCCGGESCFSATLTGPGPYLLSSCRLALVVPILMLLPHFVDRKDIPAGKLIHARKGMVMTRSVLMLTGVNWSILWFDTEHEFSEIPRGRASHNH